MTRRHDTPSTFRISSDTLATISRYRIIYGRELNPVDSDGVVAGHVTLGRAVGLRWDAKGPLESHIDADSLNHTMILMEIVAAVAAVLVVFQVLAILRGAPFVPTGARTVGAMVALADLRPGEKAADLGSGDGRIVIAMAAAGAEAHGYEINPVLVLWSRYRIHRAGARRRAFVHWGSFWWEDFSSFDVVAVFGMVHVMGQIERKLLAELRPGARVVANAFSLPSWPHERREGRVYLYRR